MQHGWHPSDPVIIQILVVGGVVVNGLFTAYDRWRRRQWEKEDLLMRAQAAKEREDISSQLQENTTATLATAQQVAETHNLTLREMLEKANAGWTALRHRHQVEEEAGAEAKGRAGLPR